MQDGKTEKLVSLITSKTKLPIKKVLVVGCGTGIEAAILAQNLRAEVVGIDIKDEFEFDAEAAKYCTLMEADATKMPFENNTFDFVYSFHALEHINKPTVAVSEIKRVLKHEGLVWIGTPNRSRWIGSIGSKRGTALQKLKWNMIDWKYKLKGKFRNEFGAHAGFTSRELQSILSKEFSMVENETRNYYLAIYATKKNFIQMIYNVGLSKYLLPAIYFFAKK
jgi:ubiquinone/menaquinone biosynthesis C-methylase UbiE